MSWKLELGQYNARIDRIAFDARQFESLANRLPALPLQHALSLKGTVALNLSLFSLFHCYGMAVHSLRSFRILWESSAVPCVSLTVRFLFELWGAAHFTRETLDCLNKPGSEEKALGATRRLVLGTRSPVPLPWGGSADEKSFNVMEFVRSLSSIYPRAEESYAFLCESCHPSMLQHGYWLMTVPPKDNWSNENFKRTGHELIGKTISICEEAVHGIGLEVNSVLTNALAVIEPELANGPENS